MQYSRKLDWTQIITTLVKSFTFLTRIWNKMIAHNGDNYTNKCYIVIYLDNNNKENYNKIRWNKMFKTDE